MLQTKTLTFSERCSPRTRRGQSIIVALLVLLLLGVAGALFVTIVARNLLNARHANRVVTADQYARAGITFADAQLSTSLDGADWRAPLQFALSDGTNGTKDLRPPMGTPERMRYDANKLALADPNDPDKEYLQAGYARYNTGAGRFLLRVTYDPVNVGPLDVPPGKYLKIESIGREGLIESIDPTTYTNNRSTDRTQAYQVAYKPIGITDYARFETNPDNRSDIANLGVISQQYTQDSSNDGGIATPGVYDFVSGSAPAYKLYPVVTTYGASDAYLKDGMTPPNFYPNPTAGTGMVLPSGSPYTLVSGDGSIHANMPLRFFGKNVVYLNNAGGSAPLFQDGIEVVGNLLLDSYSPSANLDNTLPTGGTGTPVYQQASLVLNPTVTNGKTDLKYYVAPSNSVGGFNTQGGLIRDGSMQNDVNGQPRGIKRLEPPLMDAQDPASRLPRYKVIAMTSPPRFDPKTGKPYPINADGTSPSLYGYGKAIYIDNSADIQADSSSVGGGTTLTDEWLRRTSAASAAGASKSGWNGHFYDPVGVTITLGQNLGTGTAAAPVYGIRMVRGDDAWKNPDGTPGTSRTMDAAYGPTGLDASQSAVTSNNDIVIHVEGNVRLAAGTLSPVERSGNAPTTPRHITIVTNGTAYVEGNLLKGDPDSSITVLAHDYVCLNTSQFTVGQSPQNQRPAIDVSGNLDLTDADSLVEPFNFGLPQKFGTPPGIKMTDTKTTDAATAGGYGAANPFLYVSASSSVPAANALADFSITNLMGTTVNFAVTQVFGPTTPTHLTLPLTLPPLGQSDLEQLTVARDRSDHPTASDPDTYPGDVLLERVAVLPMDIRIEAVLYAQTRSFFVIPGDWFNGKNNDTIDQFASGTTRPDLNGVTAGSTDYTNRSRFPFYGQPIDLKITIDGAVSEARPADISAQSAWMTKWGWIPQYHGSLTGETVGHVAYQPGGGSNPTAANVPAVGLQIIYNPQAAYPYNPQAAYLYNPVDNTVTEVPARYLRSDVYGRPLPFSPMLPVSTGLLYSGDSSEPPLLQ